MSKDHFQLTAVKVLAPDVLRLAYADGEVLTVTRLRHL